MFKVFDLKGPGHVNYRAHDLSPLGGEGLGGEAPPKEQGGLGGRKPPNLATTR